MPKRLMFRMSTPGIGRMPTPGGSGSSGVGPRGSISVDVAADLDELEMLERQLEETEGDEARDGRVDQAEGKDGRYPTFPRRRKTKVQYCNKAVYNFKFIRNFPPFKASLMTLWSNRGLLEELQTFRLLNRLHDWDFNAFTLDRLTNGRNLPTLCTHLFHDLGLVRHFGLDPVSVRKFFFLVERGYHQGNPYHNAVHAADVTQAMHCFLQVS